MNCKTLLRHNPCCKLWKNKYQKFYLFSNGGENENGGTPITGIKTALTNFFKKKLKGEVGAEGSSILTSGAGILDDTDLKRNLLGAGAYNQSKGTGLG